MTEMSPLRRRMIEDMTIRNLSPATQQSYIHAVSKFSRYFGRSPEKLTLEDVRTKTKASGSCGQCAGKVELLLAATLAVQGLFVVHQISPLLVPVK